MSLPTLTFNEHAEAMFEQIGAASDECRIVANDPDNPSPDHNEAGRELAIAKTKLEESLTRYNSARYRMKGIWKRDDPDHR